MASNKRDLKMWFRYDGNHMIIPGSNILSRKVPKVGRWTEMDAYECCNNPCVPGWEDAVAPANIVITVDDVGSNPVTWYFTIFYCNYGMDYNFRSLPSAVVPFIVGDSTTLITFTCNALPSWANEVDWYIGTTSGTYPQGSYGVVPNTIVLTDDYDISYALMLLVPIQQIWNDCGSTTTTTTIEGCNDLLVDGGFEEWNTNGRTYPIYWNGGERESETVHGGNYSMHLDGDYLYTFQLFTTTTTCYTFNFWYNSTVEGCAGFMIVRFAGPPLFEYLQDDGSWSEVINTIVLPSSGGEWVNYTFTIYTTSGTTHVLQFVAGEGCDVYFDDAQMCDDCEESRTTTTTTTVIPTTTTTTTIAPTTTTTTTVALTTTTTTTVVEVPSDKRLKRNVHPTGAKVEEFPEYEWEWNEIAKALGLDKHPTKGVIAQEVMHKYPDAVRLDADGYYRVNLSKLKK